MNKWLKKLKKKAILPAAAFLVAAAAIGSTFAWQKWDLDITNNLKAHDTSVEIVEKPFEPDKGIKQVSFHNSGDSSVFLRVSYSDYWVKGENEQSDIHAEPNWDITTDPAYETIILSNKLGNIEVAKKVWTKVWPEYDGTDKAAEWVDGKDGWYYYKKVLKPGGTTEKILDGVVFPIPDSISEASEEYKTLKTEYHHGANYRLFFKAEVVQCSDGSNTLNSEAVNDDATFKLFKKVARVLKDADGNITGVQWYNDRAAREPIN